MASPLTVWRRLDDAARDRAAAGRGTVVTIGNFDGVHLGHRHVLERVVGAARKRGADAVAITFDPHPLQVLHPDRAPELITGLGQRLELMAQTGLDAVLVMTFTRELAGWSPERFVVDALVEGLRAEAVAVGHDVRFGHRNSGDLTTMQALGAQHGFEVLALDDEGGQRRWSSTWIREALAAGDVETAADVLGRLHRVSGTVVHGDARGRELGYPTANLGSGPGGPVQGMVPADGIYAGWLVRPELSDGAPDSLLPAAVSIGTNPTFDGVVRRVEAYVLDRDDLDLYDEQVAFDLVTRLRETVRFEGADALVQQMGRDVEDARAVLGARAPVAGGHAGADRHNST